MATLSPTGHLLALALLAAPALAQGHAGAAAANQAAGGQRRLPLVLDVVDLDVGWARVTGPSGQATVNVTNQSGAPIELTGFPVGGADAAAFSITNTNGLPYTLPDGQAEILTVDFAPTVLGGHQAWFRVAWTGESGSPTRSFLSGLGIGDEGDELRVNGGGLEHVDVETNTWIDDWGFTLSDTKASVADVAGTDEDPLFQTFRTAVDFSYELAVPNGWYRLVLHFNEPLYADPGRRVFDITAEGGLIVDDLDIYAITGARNVAHTESTFVEITDEGLSLQFTSTIGDALICAIEVLQTGILDVTPADLTFPTTEEGLSAGLDVTLTNTGSLPLTIDDVGILPIGGLRADAFSLDFDGNILAGGESEEVHHAVSTVLLPDDSLLVPITFAPLEHDVYNALVTFDGDGFTPETLLLYGVGSTPGHPFLHVVITADDYAVDYDGSGSETVQFDGTLSHTHEPGHVLTSFEWTDDQGGSLGSGPVIDIPLALGSHEITLTIEDDNVPAETLAGSTDFAVYAPSGVPGVLARYYDGSVTSPNTLLDAVPTSLDFAEILADLSVANTGTMGGSPFANDAMVRLSATIDIALETTYDFQTTGGNETRLDVDGVPWAGPALLTVGAHTIDVRFAVASTAELPLLLELDEAGGGFGPIDPALLTHDQTALVPVINSMPAEGTTLGGNQIEILGLGFFPSDSVTVHWGGQDLTDVDFDEIDNDRIVFDSPPGSPGSIQVTVETPVGTSLPSSFLYNPSGPVPIDFVLQNTIFLTAPPTCSAFGPDRKLYVGTVTGELHVLEFDDAWNVTNTTVHTALYGLGNPAIAGICFSPWEDASPVRVYLAHGAINEWGGSAIPPGTPAPYIGQVSVLEGPNFTYDGGTSPLITGLPISNHDHLVNGMVFDNNGDLLICVGGNTNAGVIWDTIGDLPESPFSGAVLKAKLSKPGFNGTITYTNSSGVVDGDSNDQVFGWDHLVADGVDVEVFAHGVRNAFGIELHTNNHRYATDNGPNFSFGPQSTSATTEGPEPETQDEILLLEADRYYGHANRNRGRFDDRQNVYHGVGLSSIPGVFTPELWPVNSSTNGICEYRSDVFGGQMRGDLLVQQWNGNTKRVELSADGRSVDAVTDLQPWTGALDVIMGPGGAIITTAYSSSSIKILVPDDISLVGLKATDITPWRTPYGGGGEFVIGGNGFGNLGNTTVRIAGIPCTLLSVSPTRIVGLAPTAPGPSANFFDVQVSVGGDSSLLENAIRPIGDPGEEKGTWEALGFLTVPTGEVACAEVGGRLYVMGEGHAFTLVYDLVTEQMLASGAQRPFVGHHHSTEVIDGLVYVIGGLGGGSEGKVQIYDPVLNSWSTGTDMPWAAGSVQTAVIDGLIYAAGGIVGATTVDNCAVYDPVLDSWTALEPHPTGMGRNHGAAATDGERLWIFGGRGVGSGECNCVANGFDQVQVYDPVTDTWETSDDGGTSLVPLPIGRGGMGKAIFFQGEFYVFGGETLDGPGAVAGNVYDRVDVYDPDTHTWRLDQPMPTPRHGIYPVLFESRMFFAGGGEVAGFSQSAVIDAFTRQ